MAPVDPSLYSRESPYALPSPSLARNRFQSPEFPDDPFNPDAPDCGVLSLRTPTERGNVLVVDNVLDLRALELEVKRNCCESTSDRELRITYLLLGDRELKWQAKMIAPKLLPLYSGSVGICNKIVFVISIVIMILGAPIFYFAVWKENSLMAHIGVIFLCGGAASAIITGIRWFYLRSKRHDLEKTISEAQIGWNERQANAR
jgi:uncharacterized membrane protein YciS (DUF1049 family)